MKTIKHLLIVAISLISLSSCGSAYYQVYKVISADDIITKDQEMVFENADCVIYYDLWDDGGNMSFEFYNKTDHDILINLEHSFFILNGISHDYYKNRVFETSKQLQVLKTYNSYNPLNLSNSKSKFSFLASDRSCLMLVSETPNPNLESVIRASL